MTHESRPEAALANFRAPSLAPAVVVVVELEGRAQAFVRAESLEDERRMLADLLGRRCVACEVHDALKLLAQALLDRRAA